MIGSKHSKAGMKRPDPPAEMPNNADTLPPGPQARHVGVDERRWSIIEVDPHRPEDGPRVIQVTVGEKRILLTSQRTLLKIHVNPWPGAPDEWNGVPVFSPPPDDDSEYRDAMATPSNAGRCQITMGFVEMTMQSKDGTERNLILPGTAQVCILGKGDNADDYPVSVGKGDNADDDPERV